MIVRKLRLQRGWSQDHLAELTGLSVRTIQRVERGQKPSLETSKSLAAVFEVDLSTFSTEDTDMNERETTVAELAADEEAALNYAKGIKEFWTGVLVYVLLLVAFLGVFLIRGSENPDALRVLLLVFGGIGIGIVLQGVLAYELIRMPWQDFEKRVAEKRLGRKL